MQESVNFQARRRSKRPRLSRCMDETNDGLIGGCRANKFVAGNGLPFDDARWSVQ
jgi:hypothetical protein